MMCKYMCTFISIEYHGGALLRIASLVVRVINLQHEGLNKGLPHTQTIVVV